MLKKAIIFLDYSSPDISELIPFGERYCVNTWDVLDLQAKKDTTG